MENIDLSSHEEDTLFTDEEHVVLKEVNFEFEQTNKVRGIYRKMTIFNGNHCYQSIKNKHKRKYKYRVDIAYLNPHPFREHNIATNWLYSSATLFATSVILTYIGWFSELLSSKPGIYYSTSTIVCISATFISLLLFMHNTYDKVIFRTQFGNIRLIELINKYPNKVEFRKFIGRFILQVKKARVEKRFTTSKFLARELREIRRLRDETVVKEYEYQAAKKIIFQHSSFKAN
ncbi:MAG: hypothetical protein GY806_02140 [Gammaproteobacteria bacterium]|nr:hypothetical protein [Gammaproteobacteria bacterium]